MAQVKGFCFVLWLRWPEQLSYVAEGYRVAGSKTCQASTRITHAYDIPSARQPRQDIVASMAVCQHIVTATHTVIIETTPKSQ